MLGIDIRQEEQRQKIMHRKECQHSLNYAYILQGKRFKTFSKTESKIGMYAAGRGHQKSFLQKRKIVTGCMEGSIFGYLLYLVEE